MTLFIEPLIYVTAIFI